MKIAMTVLTYQVHDVEGVDPPKQIHQAKLYGQANEHGVLLEITQPDNALAFASQKEFTVTIE